MLIYVVSCLTLALFESCKGDHLCSSIGGNCQDDGYKCSGSYLTGKCDGGVTRRCCTQNPILTNTGDCSGLTIVSRDSWGARRASSSSTLATPVSYVFIHHTDGAACTTFTSCVARMKAIQNYHMDNKNWDDIGYSFLVGEDGRIYEGRGWNRVGAHTYGYNSKGYGLSYIGNFMTRNPNSAAQNAGQSWISCGVSKSKISSYYGLFGHRDTKATACPGDSFYNLIKGWPRFQARSLK